MSLETRVSALGVRTAEEFSALRANELHSSQSISLRWYGYTNNRWVSPNRLYGWANQNATTNGGVGATPTNDRRDKGLLMPSGTVIHSCSWAGHTNNTELNDGEVYLKHMDTTADTPNNASVVANEILASTALGWASNAANQLRHSDIPVGDYVLPARGFVVPYFRPVGTITATRYFYGVFTIYYTLPARA